MKVSVIGGGTWGSAFALYLGRMKLKTQLWIREADIYQDIIQRKENRTFLPGYTFPPPVSFFHNLKEAVEGSQIVFVAVPSKFCRQIYNQLAPHLSGQQIIVSLTKGLEEESLKRMSQVMEEIFLPKFFPQIAVLSGPSFAKEVAEEQPTAVVIASKDLTLAQRIQKLISSVSFRVYTSQDIIGVELAGALKNVIAIAAGILDSLQLGHNSMAALLTRGLYEITRLGLKLGAKRETFSGLAGIGDLVLTCTGKLSRNRYLGSELGKGKSLTEIVSGMKMVVEGVTTTLSARLLTQREGVEMPICEEVYQVLYNNKNPQQAVKDLMTRRLKEEHYN